MSQPKLSICIPTYNRENYLSQLLESIVIQAPNDGSIEICVSDNASTDKTEAMIRHYRNRFNYIVYHCNDTNLGADKNYLKCIALASGEYCWLMGSDDKLITGAIKEVLNYIQVVGADIFLCQHFDQFYEKYISKVMKVIDNSTDNRIFNLQCDDDFQDYCKVAVNSMALFSYMSINIFKKSIWRETDGENFTDTAYSFVGVLFNSINRQNTTVYCIPLPLVYFRALNDSFLHNQDRLKRVYLDMVSYARLATIFDSEKKRELVIDVLYKSLQKKFKFFKLIIFTSFSSKKTIEDVIEYSGSYKQFHNVKKRMKFFQKINNIKIFNFFLRIIGYIYFMIIRPLAIKISWRKNA